MVDAEAPFQHLLQPQYLRQLPVTALEPAAIIRRCFSQLTYSLSTVPVPPQHNPCTIPIKSYTKFCGWMKVWSSRRSAALVRRTNLLEILILTMPNILVLPAFSRTPYERTTESCCLESAAWMKVWMSCCSAAVVRRREPSASASASTFFFEKQNTTMGSRSLQISINALRVYGLGFRIQTPPYVAGPCTIRITALRVPTQSSTFPAACRRMKEERNTITVTGH